VASLRQLSFLYKIVVDYVYNFLLVCHYSSILCHFYRATRMHSADYLCCCKMSIRPSVKHILMCLTDGRMDILQWTSIETGKHIITLFSPSGSHTTLVILYQTAWQYSDGDECKGHEKSQFSTNISLYPGNGTR